MPWPSSEGKTVGTPRRGSIHDVILRKLITIWGSMIQWRSRTSIGPTSSWMP